MILQSINLVPPAFYKDFEALCMINFSERADLSVIGHHVNPEKHMSEVAKRALQVRGRTMYGFSYDERNHEYYFDEEKKELVGYFTDIYDSIGFAWIYDVQPIYCTFKITPTKIDKRVLKKILEVERNMTFFIDTTLGFKKSHLVAYDKDMKKGKILYENLFNEFDEELFKKYVFRGKIEGPKLSIVIGYCEYYVEDMNRFQNWLSFMTGF